MSINEYESYPIRWAEVTNVTKTNVTEKFQRTDNCTQLASPRKRRTALFGKETGTGTVDRMDRVDRRMKDERRPLKLDEQQTAKYK